MILVAGAGGFIGGHLIRTLAASGEDVRAIDVKPAEMWWQAAEVGVEQWASHDLREPQTCAEACRGAEKVYNLAAEVGGIAWIKGHWWQSLESVLINTNLLRAAIDAGVERYFFASSACVYPDMLQDRPDAPPLKEADSHPANPPDGYGWEKLYGEELCQAATADGLIECRIARLHNTYGPHGTWRGGREKAPAAICRKVAEAKLAGLLEVEVWGDGKQTRGFTYVDDCVEGIQRIMACDHPGPINLGTSELVTINDLAAAVEAAAGVSGEITWCHDVAAIEGARGRASDNSLARRVLGWEPSTLLAEGVVPTYEWIERQVAR